MIIPDMDASSAWVRSSKFWDRDSPEILNLPFLKLLKGMKKIYFLILSVLYKTIKHSPLKKSFPTPETTKKNMEPKNGRRFVLVTL